MRSEETPTRLAQWRSELLHHVLRGILVVGVVVAVPSVWLSLANDQPWIAVVDLVAFVLIGVAAVRPSLPHGVRVTLLLAAIHGLGTVLLVTVGSVGQTYLTGFVVLAALLLGTRAVVVALSVQAVTLVLIGGAVAMFDGLAVPEFTSLAAWLVVSVNTVFVSGFIAFGCSLLLRRLETSLDEEQQLTASLDERNRELELAARQRSEAREGQVLQAQLLDAVADAVVATDLEMRIRYLNPAAQDLYGASAEAALGMPLDRLVTLGEDPQSVTRLLDQVRSGLPWAGETTLHLSDGRTVPAMVTAAAVRDQSGEVTGLVGVATNVSELRDAIDRLNRSDEIRVAFLRATSHELRTPLASIVGLAETLEVHSDALDPAGRDVILERLTVNAQRLSRLVSDLLDVDRLTTGLVTATREPHDLRELVLRSIAEVDVGDREVQLDLVPVHAEVDAPKLERVVVNLVANAARHTPPSSTVTVRLRADDAAGHAVLHVRDDGPGIDPRYLDVVFDPFVQGPERHRDASPGTGLGLSLARSLVRLHDGDLTVRNVEPSGALFEVLVPLRAHDEDRVATAEPASFSASD